MFETPRSHPALRPAHRFFPASRRRDAQDVEIGGSFDGTFDGRSIKVLKSGTVSGGFFGDDGGV